MSFISKKRLLKLQEDRDILVEAIQLIPVEKLGKGFIWVPSKETVKQLKKAKEISNGTE